MSYIKITPAAESGHRTRYIYHKPGSQAVYSALDEIVGEKLHPVTGIPMSIEFDGWADDMAAPGDTREMEDFTIECITEEEFREETGLNDTPRFPLPPFLRIRFI